MRYLLLIVSIGVSNIIFAAPSLILPKEFSVLAANGKRVSVPASGTIKPLPLSIGLNRIAVIYNAHFKAPVPKGYELVRSNVYILSFYANDRVYIARYIKPSNIKSAKQFVKNARLNISEVSGGTIYSKQSRAKPLTKTSLKAQTSTKPIRTDKINITSDNKRGK